ncbi:MAG: hypothetical protein ACTHV5_10830, partial [Candidatus Corynebacterium faecigallinarum]
MPDASAAHDAPAVSTAPSSGAYAHGFARVAAVTVPVAIADPATNAQTILDAARELHEDHVGLAVFPELSL